MLCVWLSGRSAWLRHTSDSSNVSLYWSWLLQQSPSLSPTSSPVNNTSATCRLRRRHCGPLACSQLAITGQILIQYFTRPLYSEQHEQKINLNMNETNSRQRLTLRVQQKYYLLSLLPIHYLESFLLISGVIPDWARTPKQSICEYLERAFTDQTQFLSSIQCAQVPVWWLMMTS